MVGLLWKFVAALMLLSSSVFAAFIQSPIPPSSRENYLQDSDRDGRLDRVVIKFLGTVTREYLDQMVDSLTFNWVDLNGERVHYRRLAKDLNLDPVVKRRIFVDLTDVQSDWMACTGLRLGEQEIGNFRLYLKDGSEYAVPMRERMAPVVRSAHLRSHLPQKQKRKESPVRDTLNVVMSESIGMKSGCVEFLEFKSDASGDVEVLSPLNVIWNGDSSAASVILDVDAPHRLMPRDSVRLLASCVLDSSENRASDSARFIPVNGFYPLDYETGDMVTEVTSQDIPADAPIFQLLFKDIDSGYPNKQEWGVGMNVLSVEFINAVKDVLGMKDVAVIDAAKLRVQYVVKIYTNLGDFVVGTTSDVYGDDERFEGAAKRLFLKWNLMDGSRRRVGTGAYIANVAITVTYDDQLVYRSDVHHGPTTKIFGVKRR